VVSSAFSCLRKSLGEAEHLSGIDLKVFGFIPEAVFTPDPVEIIPEHRSASSRNRVHLAPDSPPIGGKLL